MSSQAINVDEINLGTGIVRIKAELEEKAVREVANVSEVEIPQGMVEVELDNMEEDMNRRLAYQGISLEQYLQMLGRTKADFRRESEEPARDSIKMRLVLEAVCKDAKLEATDAEVEEKLAELAESYGRKVEELKNNEELLGHIKQNVVSEKGIKLIVDNAKVKVVAAPEEPEVVAPAEILFDDKANRTELSTESQVWEQNGIKVVNNKGASTSNVADYANPARFYKGSDLIISGASKITKVVITTADDRNFNANFTLEGFTVTVNGTVCTIESAEAVDNVTIANLPYQIRVTSIVVTY